MKTIYKINLLLVLTLILHSCGKSFLDAPPSEMLPRESIINSLDDCEKLLRGSYSDFAAAYGTFTDIYMELVTDNVKPVSMSTSLQYFYQWTQQADNGRVIDVLPSSINMNAFSYRYYNIIRNSSFIIEKTTEFRHQHPSKADYIVGAALTNRAYAYFMLVNVFAQPYNYTPQATHPGIVYSTESNWTNTAPVRSSVAFVYEKIIEDLERAVPLFHEEAATTIKYNGNFPVALLSRVMLSKGDYSSSLKYAQQCMQKYQLLTIEKGYPDNMYKKTTIDESEALFHLLPSSSASMGYDGVAMFSNYYYQGTIDFVATTDIAQLLTENANDVRTKWVTNAGTTGWIVSKFPKGVVPDASPEEASYFLPLARVSEMYLNAAECAYHLQREDDARNYLTQLIQRANPMAPAVSSSGQDLLDLIRRERRKELTFEGFRLYDLQRWKQPIIRSDNAQYHRLNLPNDKAIAPIPVQDIQDLGIPQNPGY